MSNSGWTWGDLAGELCERGIDPDDVSADDIAGVLHHSRPEQAADELAREYR